MDARDRLRRYLEQRRELGETEFVLDTLSVADALKSLGARGEPADSPPSPRTASGSDQRQESPTRKIAEQAAGSGDWRAALRSIGAEKPEPVGEKIGRYEMPKPPAAPSPLADLKPGIVVGHPVAGATSGFIAALDSIDTVARAVAACTLCSLHGTAKNPVPGEGNPQAGFVCVGEAPGATEDETGRPFVGQAGQLLTKIIEAIHFKREDVFICNVLKHRPPGNRNPSAEEITACSPYLLRQLELLKPRVILALGTFAAQTLLQTTQTIGKLRGQVHRYYGVPLIVTYHPAALLRNPSWKRPTWEDVQLARRIFDNAAGA